jgi:hypothetical protein
VNWNEKRGCRGHITVSLFAERQGGSVETAALKSKRRPGLHNCISAADQLICITVHSAIDMI